MVKQHLIINKMIPVSFQSRSSKPHLLMWLETSCIIAIRINRLDELLYLLLLFTLDGVMRPAFHESEPCLYQAASLLVKSQSIQCIFTDDSKPLHARSWRKSPSVESVDCIEIPPHVWEIFKIFIESKDWDPCFTDPVSSSPTLNLSYQLISYMYIYIYI